MFTGVRMLARTRGSIRLLDIKLTPGGATRAIPILYGSRRRDESAGLLISSDEQAKVMFHAM